MNKLLTVAVLSILSVSSQAALRGDTMTMRITPMLEATLALPNKVVATSYYDYIGGTPDSRYKRDVIKFTCPKVLDNDYTGWVHVSQASGTQPLVTQLFIQDSGTPFKLYSTKVATASETGDYWSGHTEFGTKYGLNLRDIRADKLLSQGLRKTTPNPYYTPILSSMSAINWANGTNRDENFTVVVAKPYGVDLVKYKIQFGCMIVYALPDGMGQVYGYTKPANVLMTIDQ